MNYYGYVILGALLANYAVEFTAEFLNIKALRPSLPAGMEGIYDADAYRNSQEYTRAKTKFGLVRRGTDLALLLAFWFLGGFNWLDILLRGWGTGAISRGLLFIGALLLLRALAFENQGETEACRSDLKAALAANPSCRLATERLLATAPPEASSQPD